MSEYELSVNDRQRAIESAEKIVDYLKRNQVPEELTRVIAVFIEAAIIDNVLNRGRS